MKSEISVLMSIFNNESTLKMSIDSILNQTFKDFEFIIIDDCSTDNSFSILKEYELKDKRIKVFKNDKNLGLPASLNKGLSLCSHEFIARMDGDDISHVTRLEKQYEFMIQNDDIDVLGTDINVMNEEFNVYTTNEFPIEHNEIVLMMETKSPLAHPSVMYKKSIVLKVNGYDENLRKGQDYNLWLRLKNIAKFHNLNEKLVDYYMPIRRPLKKTISIFFDLLKSSKFSIFPWIYLVKHLLIYCRLYTPRSLK